MPAKRLSEASSDGTPNKLARTDNGGDFSGSVRKKLTGTSRTGQACDRCKVRDAIMLTSTTPGKTGC